MTHPSPTIGDAQSPDRINQLAGIDPGSRLAELRNQRLDVARFTQGSFEALLEPDDPAGVSRIERELVALRVAILTASTPLIVFHQRRLRELNVAPTKIAAVEQSANHSEFTPRESAILCHVDRLTHEPRAATPANIDALRTQGLSADAIVSIAQLIAFLSFQLRLLAGLSLLTEEQS
jgi:CMD domain protein